MDAPDPPATAAPRPPRVRARTWVLVASLAALVYAVLLLFGDLRRLGDDLARIRPSTAVITLALVLGGYGLRAFRWHLMVRQESPRPDPGASILSFLAGFSMAVTPGKVGEFVKAYYQWERDGTPVAASVAATLVERGLDVIVLILFAALGLTFLGPQSAWVFLALLVIVVTTLALLGSRRVLALVLRFLGRFHVLRKVLGTMERGQQTVRRNLRPTTSVPYLVLGVAAWSLEPTAMMLFSRDLGVPLGFSLCAFVFAAGSLLSVASLLPGGLGVFEGGTIVGLTTLTHMSTSTATALILVLRLSTLWFGMLIGSLAILVLRWTRPTDAAPSVPQVE